MRLKIRFTSVALCLAALCTVSTAQAQGEAAFRCGGEVENQAWKLWDGGARDLVVKNYLEDGLKAQGDSYGLYEFQGSTHNLLAMAVRCGRQDRVLEFARIIARAYDQLSVLPNGGGQGWLCRGGRVCKEGSSLRDTEVPLTTSQFMGLSTRVASALAAPAQRTQEAETFVTMTAMLTVDHLNRWARDTKMLRLQERASAKLAQASDGQSKWFFTDVDLWILTMYAELAGMQETVPAVREYVAAKLDPAAHESLRGLLQLFRARLSMSTVESPRLGSGKVTVADLDRGWWRHYRDNRYAGHSGKQAPVSCGGGKTEARVNLKPESVAIVESGGWDFSHARRLVHVIDALDRQRAAMVRWYKLPNDAVPAGLAPAFAAALVARVWNGDAAKPLFSNFWDGSNGWYRAGHTSGSSCFEGYGPHGLSDAFALGGFAMWSQYRPEIGNFARRLYALAGSTQEPDLSFINTYYPGLGAGGSSSIRTLARLQFWPSLVESRR